jgi:SAM-dependent methyltransferase
MERTAYQLTAAHEATHWWFVARRELVLAQVARAAAAVGTIVQPPRLLDYGCGTGFNLPLFERFGEVVGADVADEALGEFRRHPDLPRLDLRADLREHHGRFDVVVALDVLEHCDDDVAGLREMLRFLAPHGQVVLTVPAYRWLWSGEDELSRHRRRYTRGGLERACRAAGLGVVHASYFNLLVLPAMAAVVWARHLRGRDGPPESSIGPVPERLNRALARVVSWEARRVGRERLRLPAGASIVCRCRREDA